MTIPSLGAARLVEFQAQAQATPTARRPSAASALPEPQPPYSQ